jgi:hypothetical protein
VNALTRLVFTAAVTVIAVPSIAKEEYVYGPEPDWAHYNGLGETALRAQLPDPDNWSVSWPYGYMQARWWHKGKTPGWLTCGIATAKVPAPGQRSPVIFVAVIDYDKVLMIDISQKYSNSLVNVACADFAAQGKLPTASLRPAVQDLTVARIGLTIRPMPEGAYVVATSAGSASSRAGLMPCTVITKANGIALAGLGGAMTEILDSEAAVLTLETATGGRVEVITAP